MKVKFFDLIYPSMIALTIVTFLISVVLLRESLHWWSGFWFLVSLVSLTLARKGYFEELEREKLYTYVEEIEDEEEDLK